MSALGNLTGLLRLLRDHPDVVEADLQRFYGIDYRDRWRFDERGRRRLTLRRIWVLVRNLPSTSALAGVQRGGKPDWSLEAHLLDDLRIVMTSTEKHQAKPHPLRPRPDRYRRPDDLARRRKLADARRRAKARREARGGMSDL